MFVYFQDFLKQYILILKWENFLEYLDHEILFKNYLILFKIKCITHAYLHSSTPFERVSWT